MLRIIQLYTQQEYSRILDAHQASDRGLSQHECERILIAAGATYQQAKNGAYVYLHHGNSVLKSRMGSVEEYSLLLNEFGASDKSPRECIRYLESLGFSYGQAKSAVYVYRKRKGLINRF